MMLDELYGRHIKFYTSIDICLDFTQYSYGIIRICEVDGDFFLYERYANKDKSKYLVFINGICQFVEGRQISWVDNLESEMTFFVIEDEEDSVIEKFQETFKKIDLGKLLNFGGVRKCK